MMVLHSIDRAPQLPVKSALRCANSKGLILHTHPTLTPQHPKFCNGVANESNDDVGWN